MACIKLKKGRKEREEYRKKGKEGPKPAFARLLRSVYTYIHIYTQFDVSYIYIHVHIHSAGEEGGIILISPGPHGGQER